VGSGVTRNNVHQYKGIDGLIVGSYFKKNGRHVSYTLTYLPNIFKFLKLMFGLQMAE